MNYTCPAGWFSAEDKWPTQGLQVLGWLEEGYAIVYYDDGIWWLQNSTDFTNSITHWRYLPIPPNEEQDTTKGKACQQGDKNA